MHKRGVSELIATVLLIAVTITAAAAVYAFVSPLIQDAMSESTQCNNADVSIVSSCYNSSSDEVLVEIGFGEDNSTSGISIQVFGEDSAGGVSIKEGQSADKYVRELNSPVLITLPGQNEARTYAINSSGMNITSPFSVSAYPMVKIRNSDKLCKKYAQSGIRGC
jgi:flagellin-like protein